MNILSWFGSENTVPHQSIDLFPKIPQKRVLYVLWVCYGWYGVPFFRPSSPRFTAHHGTLSPDAPRNGWMRNLGRPRRGRRAVSRLACLVGLKHKHLWKYDGNVTEILWKYDGNLVSYGHLLSFPPQFFLHFWRSPPPTAFSSPGAADPAVDQLPCSPAWRFHWGSILAAICTKIAIFFGFHKRGYPNSWMVYSGKAIFFHEWFRGTPISGDPHLHPFTNQDWQKLDDFRNMHKYAIYLRAMSSNPATKWTIHGMISTFATTWWGCCGIVRTRPESIRQKWDENPNA